MAAADTIRGPVSARPEEAQDIANLRTALEAADNGGTLRYFLADSAGRRLELPASVFRVLVDVVRAMARGQSVAVLHYDEELTTQQAADLLQVSRPYLVRLLEEGKIPYHMVGTHRRIYLRDVLAYKELRDRRRREALRELRRASEALGLYDEPDVGGG
ncbi:helix-turn-helix domain-containing protein [Thermaerobacter sp. PB12/4term]|uniref:helix-turn-helix domain-containing protein n=1 Tax=Thermaerobacter sp. PB12/4term TaxID=2293838 RepID=UPI000E32AFFC|nr:helix-turn-helix domain-containing protein [Thermaerobacter sp. PB12/4term]QIA26756.1 helix-turn-helix domain-containing protein [Thermaerobacter sp. PB12/4term]